MKISLDKQIKINNFFLTLDLIFAGIFCVYSIFCIISGWLCLALLILFAGCYAITCFNVGNNTVLLLEIKKELSKK